MEISLTVRLGTWTALLGAVVLGWGPPATAAPGPSLAQQMRLEAVVVVPPRTVHIRGDRVASTHHRPLDGFDPETYPALFGELAESLLAKPPLRWQVTTVDPGAAFYDAVETEDPDDDPAATLAAMPSEIGEAAYLAVFRYAELAFDILEQPSYRNDGQLEVRRSVRLILDLQLVIYDATDGTPLGTFDAETAVPVPEILPPAQKIKPFYRATVGNLRRMAQTVKKEG